MNDNNDIDLVTAFRKLLAENKSQAERLEDYARIINSRDNEIEMLQKMLSDANEYKSSVDNQLTELKDLQQYLKNLQIQETLSRFDIPVRQQQIGGAKTSAENQLESLRTAYTDLQSQLLDLHQQLQEMNKKNLQLQIQTSRIAELESLLENASEGRKEAHQEGNHDELESNI